MDAERLYRRLQFAASDIFGEEHLNMIPDKWGRGGSSDDIVYAITHQEIPDDDGEWGAKRLQFVIRAVKLYT